MGEIAKTNPARAKWLAMRVANFQAITNYLFAATAEVDGHERFSALVSTLCSLG